jgi:LuxR family transcriptional regulator, maltose regulon positive regulatory protein
MVASVPILATKLYIPPPPPKVVVRARLIERLDEGLIAGHKLALISAPAGFGKTALVSEWVHKKDELNVAWLSLDEADNDLARFMTYLLAALRTVVPDLGKDVLQVCRLRRLHPPKRS